MGLETESPPRVLAAVACGELSVLLDVGAVHGLQEEVIEVEPLEFRRRDAVLREDELQLVAGALPDRGAGFRAHADPVESRWSLERAVRFDGNLEAEVVETVDQRRIELQEWLTACDHNEALRRSVAKPLAGDFLCELVGPCKLGSAHKIGIAKLANRVRTILFATCPQIAAGETQEHRWPPCVRSFALERVVDLFNVIHRASCVVRRA